MLVSQQFLDLRLQSHPIPQTLGRRWATWRLAIQVFLTLSTSWIPHHNCGKARCTKTASSSTRLMHCPSAIVHPFSVVLDVWSSTLKRAGPLTSSVRLRNWKNRDPLPINRGGARRALASKLVDAWWGAHHINPRLHIVGVKHKRRKNGI